MLRRQAMSLLGILAFNTVLGTTLLFTAGCGDASPSGSVVEVDEQAHTERQGKMQDMYKQNQKTKATRQR